MFSNLAGLISKALESKLKLSIATVRKICQVIAFIAPSALFGALCVIKDPNTALVLLTIAMCLGAFSQAAFWVNIVDVSPTHAGMVMGVSNTIASLSGIIGNPSKKNFIHDC